MTTAQVIFSILLMTMVTFLLRATPFFFKKFIERNDFFLFIKDKLPLMMMVVLVFYATGFHHLNPASTYVKPMLAILATVLVHIAWRNFLLSIVVGTSIHLVLLNI